MAADTREDVTVRLSSEHEIVPGLETDAFASTIAGAGAVKGAADPARPGRRVGPYRVVREVGHGGMGSVYLAVRDDDQYRKEVALKLLRGDLGTDAAARLVDERQILATLDHPAIVKLLDGGTTDDGLPFLVMENVAGVPITEHCQKHGLGVRERLELFRRVCAAVQYAHQQLIVHRDIKPTNILVAPDGTPKLLDFGIAKLLGDGVRTAQTRTGMHVLTPEYGSPEQARGEPISVATDVYSLGAVLYEILSGAKAHRFQSESMVMMLEAICATDPPKPSSVAPLARRRALAGDLDNIVLKALQKEPARRYATVEQFSEDLRRHLVGLPVAARASTWPYRAGKLLRRHRGAVTAGVLLLATLSTATVVSLRQARRADAQARRADAQAHRADEQAHRADQRFNDLHRLASSLVFELDGKIQGLAGATAARELIVSRALEYLDGLVRDGGGDGDDEPELSYDLARGYIKVGDMQSHVRMPNLGRPRDARVSYGKALDLLRRQRAAGNNAPKVRWALAEVLFDLGYLYRWEGQHALARTTLLEGMQLVDSMSPTETFDHAVVILGVFSLWAIDKEARALPAMQVDARRLLELATEWAVGDASAEPQYWVGMGNELVGFAAELAGDPDAARAAYERAIAIFEKLLADTPGAETYRSDLAYVTWSLGRTLGGGGDPELWLPGLGQPAAGEAAIRESLHIAEGLIARDAKDARTTVRVAATVANLAAVVAGRDPAEALALYERSAAIYAGLPTEAREWSYSRKGEWFQVCAMAEVLAQRGRRADAEAAIKRGRELVEPIAAAAGASFRDRGALFLCQTREARARIALGEKAAAAALLVEVDRGLRGLIAARPEPITPYLGLLEVLELRARLEPDREQACARRAEAAAALRAWPGPPTDYTRKRQAELDPSRCR